MIKPPLKPIRIGFEPESTSGSVWTDGDLASSLNGGSRRGFTMVELLGTCLLLGILFATTIPMFLIIGRERRSSEQRQFALQHATNLLEQASVRSWEDLVPGELKLPDADTDLKSVLPGLERTLLVKQIEGDLPSRQIVASVRWQNHTGSLNPPVQISAWVYPVNEAP